MRRLRSIFGCDSLFGTPNQWLVGRTLDTKSNLCPIPVQTLSIVRLIKCKIQSLSTPCPIEYRVCRVLVQWKAAWTEIGQENPEFVMTLSKTNCSETKFLTVDILWTEIWHGQTLDKDKILYLGQWWNYKTGHTLDKHLTWTDIGHTFYMDRPWTMSELYRQR